MRARSRPPGEGPPKQGPLWGTPRYGLYRSYTRFGGSVLPCDFGGGIPVRPTVSKGSTPHTKYRPTAEIRPACAFSGTAFASKSLQMQVVHPSPRVVHAAAALAGRVVYSTIPPSPTPLNAVVSPAAPSPYQYGKLIQKRSVPAAGTE